MAQERRICWPQFDATCLEGGCIYCNDNPYRAVELISRKVHGLAAKDKTVLNRGNGLERDPIEAFQYGWMNNWNNADSRDLGSGLPL